MNPLIATKNLLRDTYFKYFSEVGYLRRDLHWQSSHRLGLEEIRQREALAQAITLNEFGKSTLALLNQQGYAKLRISDIPGLPNPVDYMAELVKNFGEPSHEEIMKQRSNKSKTYWTNIWQRPTGHFDPLQEFAMHPGVTSIIAKYLGQIPVLQEMAFYYSPPASAPTTQLVGSQGWHLDNEQRTKLKIFISPFEMTPDNGPTTFLPLGDSDQRLYKNYPGYFDDSQARQFGLNLANKKSMTATPGEFHLADTSRLFHYGSRDVKQARWLLIITYGPIECNLAEKNWRRIMHPAHACPEENAQIIRNIQAQ